MSSSPQTDNLLDTDSATRWKSLLKDNLRPDWVKEIDDFETEIRLKKQGKIDDKVFAETRLRHGVYGQRYDNGKRHDGKIDRPIPFPSQDVFKGPATFWDAPGMLRIKIPYGGMSLEQMRELADLAEEYSDSICHITTRQDVQLHFIHIEDTPTVFRRLAAVGITTKEACGNTIRNITGCPIAGVCQDESFDVTPYADAAFEFLLGHPDAQDFGRKFKISFSGCDDKPCALAGIHDIGFIAKVKNENGVERRGFKMLVGGGLGAVPYQAKIFDDFIPEAEILPIMQAICRVFTVHGEKKNRNKARMKFLIADWGLEKFKDEVQKNRAELPFDPRWMGFLNHLEDKEEETFVKAAKNAGLSQDGDADFKNWFATNVVPQRQKDFYTVTISLPLGDITSNQMRDLANVAQKYVPNTIRTSVEQNILLRWVKGSDLVLLYHDLQQIHLADIGAGSILDITACPGTDTCKLGISSSRGLAAVLKEQMAEKFVTMDSAVKNLHVKISGCFNSCGQHHVADIGFYGVSRKIGNYLVPHFQLVLGGTMANNAESYGLAVMALPSKAIPKTLDRLLETYLKERQGDESFQNFITRKGKVELKTLLNDLVAVPDYATDPTYYVDYSDVREYSKSDIGIGECAGEVVSLADFGLKAAEREIFEAQLLLDGKDYHAATDKALLAMLSAAEGLVKNKNPFITGREQLISEFKTRYCDTKIFYDPFAGDRFANFFFKALDAKSNDASADRARQSLEEAQLFIEAAHSCLARAE